MATQRNICLIFIALVGLHDGIVTADLQSARPENNGGSETVDPVAPVKFATRSPVAPAASTYFSTRSPVAAPEAMLTAYSTRSPQASTGFVTRSPAALDAVPIDSPIKPTSSASPSPSPSPSPAPTGLRHTPSAKPSSVTLSVEQACVTTENQLRLAIASSSEDIYVLSRIRICSDIAVTAEITLDNKVFDLYCDIPADICQLNAGNINRIFTGSPAFAKFTNIDFANANASGDKGGALFLSGNGEVSFIDSHFSKNSAMRGGAMYIGSARLTVTIRNCLFDENQATLVRFNDAVSFRVHSRHFAGQLM